MINVPTPRHLMDKVIEVRPRTVAVYNDGTPDNSWAASSPATTFRCLVRPGPRPSTLEFGAPVSIVSYEIIADPIPLSGVAADLTAWSKVIYASNTYTVRGEIRDPADSGSVLKFTIERDA